MTPVRVVGIATAITAVLLAVISIFGIDISAMRDWEQDTIVRTQAPATAQPDRYADPSPHSVWLPSDLFVWESIRSGHLPVWNRLQGGGYSPVLGLQEGVFHPLRWMTAVVPRMSAPSALIVLALAAGFCGMFLLTRFALGLATWSAVVASVAYTFSAATISFVHFSGALLPIMHIPWVVFLLRRGPFTALTISIALLLISGHPLIIACAILTIGCAALITVWDVRSLKPILRLAAGGALAVLLAAPAIVPTAVSFGDLWTYKTQTGAGHAYIIYSWSEWIATLRAMLIDVYPYGTCCLDLDAYYVYIGIPALALIVASVAADFRRNRIALLLLLAAFILAVPGPWMAPLIRLLSFFKPWYLMGLFTFFFGWMVGASFEALMAYSRAARPIAIALAIIMCTTYVWRSLEVFQPRVRAAPPASPALTFLRQEPAYFRITTTWGQNHIPNSAIITGVEDLRLSAPILPIRYHWWWKLLDPNVIMRSFPTHRVTDILDSPLVGDFNVKYVVMGRYKPATSFRTLYDPRTLDAEQSPRLLHLPLAIRTQWLEIRQLAGPLKPRAHFAPRVVRVPGLREAYDLLDRYENLPVEGAVLESEDPVPLPSFASGSARVSYPHHSRAVLVVESTTGGLVVLHDSFFEGWSATLDGAKTSIYAVNILSRGVVVPAGKHSIVMSFSPPGMKGAVALSAIGALLLMFIAIPARQNRRDQRTPDPA